MDERKGSLLLATLFRAEGLEIAENVRFEEAGISVTLDGYDSKRRIGFEFITTEAGDREEFTADVLVTLEQKMRDGSLYLFLIDENDISSEEELSRYASMFLSELRRRGALS